MFHILTAAKLTLPTELKKRKLENWIENRQNRKHWENRSNLGMLRTFCCLLNVKSPQNVETVVLIKVSPSLSLAIRSRQLFLLFFSPGRSRQELAHLGNFSQTTSSSPHWTKLKRGGGYGWSYNHQIFENDLSGRYWPQILTSQCQNDFRKPPPLHRMRQG